MLFVVCICSEGIKCDARPAHEQAYIRWQCGRGTGYRNTDAGDYAGMHGLKSVVVICEFQNWSSHDIDYRLCIVKL